MKQNLHTHSIFCDGKDTIEEMTLEAISKGFDILGFLAMDIWTWIQVPCEILQNIFQRLRELN